MPAAPAVAVAWRLWALFSEALLAATHLKVLFCIGKPIPADELSNKRWTYFLYDLLSPWIALASIASPYILPALTAVLAATASSNSVIPKQANGYLAANCCPNPWTSGTYNTTHYGIKLECPGTSNDPLLQNIPVSLGNATDNTAAANGSASYSIPNVLVFQQNQTTALRDDTNFDGDVADYYSPPASIASDQDSMAVQQQMQQEEIHNSSTVSQQLHLAPASDLLQTYKVMGQLLLSSVSAMRPTLQQLLLLFVGAHALLHLYYIVSWHTAHSKNVVQMSASSSIASRAARFNTWEVVWFFVGTGYDIVTHIVVCALLVQSLRGERFLTL